MKCYVLTGISRKTIDEIVRRYIRTIELRSAHNVATALRVELGNCVFLTPAKLSDLGRGCIGIISEVTGKEVQSHSVFFATTRYFEENEMTVVRLKLEPKGLGRIVKVYNIGILDTTEAEVVEVSYFDAR
ncbi:MAG TPA: DUF473 domain-containing protein [Archaeoglobus veneficus]|nr:DUF473 domain-containing protein [Archaeoglobus veneficus]